MCLIKMPVRNLYIENYTNPANFCLNLNSAKSNSKLLEVQHQCPLINKLVNFVVLLYATLYKSAHHVVLSVCFAIRVSRQIQPSFKEFVEQENSTNQKAELYGHELARLNCPSLHDDLL